MVNRAGRKGSRIIVRVTMRFGLLVRLWAVMVSSMSAKSAFHAYLRVRHQGFELRHRCRPFRPGLQSGAASLAKHEQGREAQPTAVHTTPPYRSDMAVSQSLDRDVAVGIPYRERYGGGVCQDICGFKVLDIDFGHNKPMAKPAFT